MTDDNNPCLASGLNHRLCRVPQLCLADGTASNVAKQVIERSRNGGLRQVIQALQQNGSSRLEAGGRIGAAVGFKHDGEAFQTFAGVIAWFSPSGAFSTKVTRSTARPLAQ